MPEDDQEIEDNRLIYDDEKTGGIRYSDQCSSCKRSRADHLQIGSNGQPIVNLLATSGFGPTCKLHAALVPTQSTLSQAQPVLPPVLPAESTQPPNDSSIPSNPATPTSQVSQ